MGRRSKHCLISQVLNKVWQAVIWGQNCSKVVLSLGEASSGEDGNFVADVSPRGAGGRHRVVRQEMRCGEVELK